MKHPLRLTGLCLSLLLAAACKDKDKKIDESNLFFDDTKLHEIKIEVADADVPAMVPGQVDRVPCTFTFDGEKFQDVGIRIKGGFGSLQDLNGKPGFSVKTNEFVQGQEILDVKKFTLDNAVQDPSFLSAHIGHSIFRDAGVPTSRTAYARVTFNGELFGVYLMVEGYNTDFLENHFNDTTGNIYEGPGDVLNVDSLDLDSNQDINDRSDLAALRDILVNASNEQLIGAISQVVDLEELLTYWAVEALAYHWDGYAVTGSTDPFPLACCSPNNFNLYHEPTLNKFFFLPHGIDSLFIDVNADVLNPPSNNSSLPARLFQLPEIKQRLADKIRFVLDNAWDTNLLQSKIDEAIDLIRDSVEEKDRNPGFTVASFETGINNVKNYINQRPQIVRDQLTAAGF